MAQNKQWTAAEVDDCLKRYAKGEGEDVDVIAAALSRSRQSIIGQLTAKKVYVKPVKPAKQPKNTGPTKDEIRSEITKAHDLDMAGGETASRDFLLRLQSFLNDNLTAPE